ncbi:MAG TPA: hypothetical protein VFO10_08570 [Oligoflexus sp.]|uniref:hypothetical protein n=1 Tax=Oligoflexus sp. TaxID=1971216 RepID=UPI002D7FF31A|nr:hypothetical protein [Oligoflexus sp.]HET9237291.1 hypothetical protein [Oligoflexus sp.]
MGLRHRTAVSMIRMQRRQAEAKSARVHGKPPPRSVRGVSFSHIDPTAPRQPSAANALHRHDQDESLRLLQRLREALHPWTDEKSQVNKEYESLQDELQRLTQHMSRHKSGTTPEVWDNQTEPYPYAAHDGPDRLPYRTIKIVSTETQTIERLDVTPLDLSRYRQVFQEPPAPLRTLTLVPPSDAPAPEAPGLSIEEEAQLGHATANLTQQSLEIRGTGSPRIAISPKVALSLLDS